MPPEALAREGFVVLGPDAATAAWAGAALAAALPLVADVGLRARWLRHGGTWFVGVDVLPNEPDGSVGGVALDGPWRSWLTLPPLHAAQVSAVWPGYPGRDPEDSDAAHRFRLTRDAAHLDGMLAEGPAKRRFLREPHAFVLGLPLAVPGPGASPLVVWPGSHRLMRAALTAAMAGVPPAALGEVDLTEAYAAARAEVFRTCPRRELDLRPGQSVVLHRMTVHGVAPWAGGQGPRIAAYFRPLLRSVADWFAADPD